MVIYVPGAEEGFGFYYSDPVLEAMRNNSLPAGYTVNNPNYMSRGFSNYNPILENHSVQRPNPGIMPDSTMYSLYKAPDGKYQMDAKPFTLKPKEYVLKKPLQTPLKSRIFGQRTGTLDIIVEKMLK